MSKDVKVEVDGEESVTEQTVTLFRLDMGVKAGKIEGLNLVWNGEAVGSLEFAATVLNEVRRQLDDTLVTHGLLMQAMAARAAAAKLAEEEVGDGEE